jgi:fructosamine-3-kinase
MLKMLNIDQLLQGIDEGITKNGANVEIQGFGSSFVKTAANGETTFEPEALGLRLLHRFSPEDLVVVPQVGFVGLSPASSSPVLVMTKLNLLSRATPAHARTLGTALGRIHLDGSAARFGLAFDGNCGPVVQLNNCQQGDVTWVEFWQEFRLGPQLRLIEKDFPELRQVSRGYT